MTAPTVTCRLCGRMEVVKPDGRGFPPDIAKRDTLHKASTQGPWHSCRYSQAGVDVGPWCTGDDERGPYCGNDGFGEADAEFIADAHEQMPRATAALRAVLALHQVSGDMGGYWQGRCIRCVTSWPCATVRAITEALGVDAEVTDA